MKIVDQPLPKGCYFEELFCKDLILLHFTAGPNALSAYYTFQQKPKQLGYPVSTAFVVDSADPGSGKIFSREPFDVWKLFDPQLWSYHLGIAGPYAQNHRHDKRSIGIEIANIGPLTLGHDGDTLTWGQDLVYGRLSNPHPGQALEIMHLPTPFRGCEYFVPMPQAQVDATVALVAELCTKFQIPKVIPPLSRRFVTDLAYFSEFKGVVSHVNFIDKWKWDHAPGHSDAIWSGLINLGFVEDK
jgi:N-acetyl-anhydromuramyl-L-alanine amidase AmpD